jgi:hypothetical protein
MIITGGAPASKPAGQSRGRSSRHAQVQADSFLEQAGEAHGEDAGAAPNVQEPSAAIQAKLPSKKSLKSRRIGGPTAAVVDSRPVVDRRVVSHHQTVLAV